MRSVFYPLRGTPLGMEECRICGRLTRLRLLRRCYRCGKLYCKSCIIEDPVDRNYLVCLRCARRSISPKKAGSKYDYLTTYLARRAEWSTWAKLTFRKIEEIIGDDLPPSAEKDESWWSNWRSKPHARAWLNVGWRVHRVNLKEKYVTFIREPKEEVKRRRRSTRKKPLKLPEFKPRRPRRPSLTKIARAYGRLKNIERKRAAPKRYRGKFKPKTAYEKRLYKKA